MVITRRNSSTGDKSVFAGPMITNSTMPDLEISQGWSMISWPFEGSNDINAASSGLTTAGSLNDYMWIYRNGVYKKVRKASSAWMMSGGGAVPADVKYIRFGEGVFYSNTVGTLTWSPSSP
jgi:hypothetical protein